jgi:zinc transporter 1
LHVLLKSRQKYMVLASQIRKVLHGYGIHSATIQPEFIEDQVDEKYQIELADTNEDDHNDESEDTKTVHISSNNHVYDVNNSASSEVI